MTLSNLHHIWYPSQSTLHHLCVYTVTANKKLNSTGDNLLPVFQGLHEQRLNRNRPTTDSLSTINRRLSAEEKGKAVAGNPSGPPRLRIRAPDFDPSELIKENLLTLVGRLTNPKEQKMSSVLPYLAKKWNLVGLASGADMGNGCFQFRFNEEEDISSVLANRPYQYGRWMRIVQCWEPIISSSFPSQIPFWISFRGIPLHYWHEKVVRNIGLELGELETYEVTKTSARVRVIVDGLKPLIMEAAMDFDSGEESIISLHYENLGNHCSICYRLSHLQSHCPERPTLVTTRQIDINAEGQPIRQTAPISSHSLPWNTTVATENGNQPYQQRLDRHGKPFGDRVSTATFRPTGPKNKIAPRLPLVHDSSREQLIEGDEKEYTSPPYTRRRLNNHGKAQERETHSTRHHGSPIMQW